MTKSEPIKSEAEKRYKINVIVGGCNLTYNNCILLSEKDPAFIRVIDKFGVELKFNKNSVQSMEVLR